MKKGDVLRKWVAGIQYCPGSGPGTYAYYHLVYGNEKIVSSQQDVQTVLTYGEPMYTHDLTSEQEALFSMALRATNELTRVAELKRQK